MATETINSIDQTLPAGKNGTEKDPAYFEENYKGCISEHEGQDVPDRLYDSDSNKNNTARQANKAVQGDEEGVEVVLGDRGLTKVVDKERSLSPQRRPTPDQNVFRVAHAVRERPGRQSKGPAQAPSQTPHLQVTESLGHAPSIDYHNGRPYPVPPYDPSGSFDEGSSPYQRQSHFSPNVQYPNAGGRYASEDINVISPTHKGDPKYRAPYNQRSRQSNTHPNNYYQYPPTSPVSNPGTGQTKSPPRLRNFAVRRPDGPYSKAQRREKRGEQHPDDGTWNPFPAPARSGSSEFRSRPPLVTESSFDSDYYAGSHYSHPSQPLTPGSHLPPHHNDDHQHFQNNVERSWGAGSYDSSTPTQVHYDDYRAQGYGPPESPYSHYSTYPSYSGHGYYNDQYSNYRAENSYDDDEQGMLKNYNPDRDGGDNNNNDDSNDPKIITGNSIALKNDKTSNGITLPEAAHEVDFPVTDPPLEPITPPSTEPVCGSLADVNGYDVLCGRGGGTNSQIGNKRFRKLVQDFQPTYLLARRKEKPLLARTIVLIIRKRGGHFLRKDDETGNLYDVGDAKAEAKTSQALREGLDVRATKSASNGTNDKGKKKKKKSKANVKTEVKDEAQSKEKIQTTVSNKNTNTIDAKTPSKKQTIAEVANPTTGISSTSEKAEESTPKKSEVSKVSNDKIKVEDSPLTLPTLQEEEVRTGMVHPHSPEALKFRKRRRMRSAGCSADKFFPDFCPPRADLTRSGSLNMSSCSISDEVDVRHRLHINGHEQGDIRRYESEHNPLPGCTDIALEIMTGSAGQGFCLGPSKWK